MSHVSSRYASWWRDVVVVNEQMLTNKVQIEKNLPLVFCRQKRDAKSLATHAALSGNLEETPEVYVVEDGLTSVQHRSKSSKTTEKTGKRNDLDDETVLNNYDNVEEDTLMIAQLLNQSEKVNNSEKLKDAADELVLNNVTPSLLAICHEAPQKLNHVSKPVELHVQIMSSSDKFEKSKLSAKEQTEKKKDAVVSKTLRFTSEHAKMCAPSMPTSDKPDKGQYSTERQTDRQEDAVGNPEDDVINIDEENWEDTTSELQHLGLDS